MAIMAAGREGVVARLDSGRGRTMHVRRYHGRAE